MTGPKDPKLTPQGNAPSWVDEVLSAPAAPHVPQARHGGEARLPGAPETQIPQPQVTDAWAQSDAARDLRLPGDPPRPAPANVPFDSDDWVARATGGQVRDPLPPRPAATADPRTPAADAWGDPVAPARTPITPMPVREDVGQKKLIAALLAIFLGSLGVHKFYLGMNAPGLWMLGLNLGIWVVAFVVSLLTLFLASFIMFPLAGFVASVLGVVGLIEGIIYLTKSDADFQRDYLYGKKPWF